MLPMATPSGRPLQINPAMRVVMRLPETDATKDPWTGAPNTRGRNFVDESAIDENVALAAPEGKSPAEVLDELEGPQRFEYVSEVADAPLKPQFTLAELMILTTVAAVGLAGARVLPAGPFACLVGILGFVAMWLTGHYQIRHRWAQLGVWGLILMYVVVAAFAIIRS